MTEAPDVLGTSGFGAAFSADLAAVDLRFFALDFPEFMALLKDEIFKLNLKISKKRSKLRSLKV